jgi:hypothetical protein
VAGRHVCQGEIARIRPVGGHDAVVLPAGMLEDPPRSGHWRFNARAIRKLAGGEKPHAPSMGRQVGDRQVPWNSKRPGGLGFVAELPFTRRCPEPRCNCLATVTSDLLSL